MGEVNIPPPQPLGVEIGQQHHMLTDLSESVARPAAISRKLCRPGASPADGGEERRRCWPVSEGASSIAELCTTGDGVPSQRLRADQGAAPSAQRRWRQRQAMRIDSGQYEGS